MPGTAIVALIVAFLAGVLLPFALIPLLKRLGVIDVPNDRSSHTITAVRGLGLTITVAIMLGFSIIWFTADNPSGGLLPVVAGVALAAAILGWVEDYRGVSVGWRFSLQLIIGALGTTAMVILTGSSWWWILVGALALSAYINVANFMDGINGISGLHGMVVGLFFAGAGAIDHQTWLIAPSLVVAAAFASFLPWNLGRGHVFLGDVGSYLLGGSLAALGAAAFLNGMEAGYLLGPVVIYLADTGYTLLVRIRGGERWYAAHRQHVYQRLTDVGLSHLGSSLMVAVATALCAGGAMLAVPSNGVGQYLWGVFILFVVFLYLSSPAWIGRLRGKVAA
ncbi:UDP-phosphate glycosyltransferase [Arthrobacter rhombi]|uniref:UDP-phosphate glycosyltransferase n=1 Tax=Arthrobacter rhombi TaxID=71253 RepID=UPI003FD5D055